ALLPSPQARLPRHNYSMKTATPIRLREYTSPMGRPARVDKARGILYGVKLLGQESRNGRRYLPEAIRNAVKLYEGCPVSANHRRDPKSSPDVRNRIGWIEGVRVDRNGDLRGNVHLLSVKDPLSIRLMEAAERHPERIFGFSHDALGSGEKDRSGIFVVDR